MPERATAAAIDGLLQHRRYISASQLNKRRHNRLLIQS
jgi:hypothetical protein